MTSPWLKIQMHFTLCFGDSAAYLFAVKFNAAAPHTPGRRQCWTKSVVLLSPGVALATVVTELLSKTKRLRPFQYVFQEENVANNIACFRNNYSDFINHGVFHNSSIHISRLWQTKESMAKFYSCIPQVVAKLVTNIWIWIYEQSIGLIFSYFI